MNPGCAAEQHAWREVKDGWRPLYGDVDKIGVAVEWHDFRTERSFNWGRTFHLSAAHGAIMLRGTAVIMRSPLNRCRHRAARTIAINS
jgi:hypothetical protein